MIKGNTHTHQQHYHAYPHPHSGKGDAVCVNIVCLVLLVVFVHFVRFSCFLCSSLCCFAVCVWRQRCGCVCPLRIQCHNEGVVVDVVPLTSGTHICLHGFSNGGVFAIPDEPPAPPAPLSTQASTRTTASPAPPLHPLPTPPFACEW